MKLSSTLFSMALVLIAVLVFAASSAVAQHQHGGHQQHGSQTMPPREQMNMDDMDEMMVRMDRIMEKCTGMNKHMDEMMKAGMMAGSTGLMNAHAMMRTTHEMAKNMQTMLERMYEIMQDEDMMQDANMQDHMQSIRKRMKEMQSDMEGLTKSLDRMKSSLPGK